jgi:hypothetical protein
VLVSSQSVATFIGVLLAYLSTLMGLVKFIMSKIEGQWPALQDRVVDDKDAVVDIEEVDAENIELAARAKGDKIIGF